MLTSLTAQGAIPDAREIRDAVMNSNSPSLTSASADFTSDDVGKSVIVSGAGASGAKLRATIASFVSESAVDLSVSATTSVDNATAVFGTDCSTALLAGLQALSTARGGVLEIDGLFLLVEPVSLSFGGETDTIGITIRGTGTDSAFWLGTDSTADAISLTGAKVTISDINFVGLYGSNVDARRVLNLLNIGAWIEGCGFHGIAASQGEIHATGCYLNTRDLVFSGSFAMGGLHCNIENWNWLSYSDERSQFIDYGYFRSRYYGKSGIGGNLGWIRAGTSTTSLGARGAGVFRMTDTVMDEATMRGVVIVPTSGRIPHVELDGLRQNLTSAETGRGLHMEKVDSAVIRNCWQGLSPVPTLIGHFQDCGTVLIDSLKLSASVNKISATNVEALILKDTTGVETFTFSNVNYHPVRSRYGNFAIVKSGAVSDADFDHPPAFGTLGFDRQNNRLYVNRLAGGGWLYFDKDGGEVLGPELVVNGSGQNGTVGWTTANGATLTAVSGPALRVTNTAPSGRIYQAVQVVPGQSYHFAAIVPNYTAGSVIRVGASPGSGDYVSITGVTGGTGSFVSNHSTLYVTLIINSSTTGHYSDFTGVSLRAS